MTTIPDTARPEWLKPTMAMEYDHGVRLESVRLRFGHEIDDVPDQLSARKRALWAGIVAIRCGVNLRPAERAARKEG